MEERKAWTKPQLVILGRGKPEENVLKHCKHLAQSGPITSGCRGRGKMDGGACSGLGQS
jgi:hypothetical protein